MLRLGYASETRQTQREYKNSLDGRGRPTIYAHPGGFTPVFDPNLHEGRPSSTVANLGLKFAEGLESPHMPLRDHDKHHFAKRPPEPNGKGRQLKLSLRLDGTSHASVLMPISEVPVLLIHL